MEKSTKIPTPLIQKHILPFLKPSEQIKMACASKAYFETFCSKYSIDQSQFPHFLKYLNIFIELRTIDPQSEYINTPNEIDLYHISTPKEVTKQTIQIAIAFFINAVSTVQSPVSHKIKLNIQSEDELKAQINIVQHLQQADKYSYHLNRSQSDFSIESLFSLYKLINRKYTPVNYFDSVIEHCITSSMSYELYFVDLDKISIDKAIEYSKHHPNKIQRIQCNNENESKEKLKQLAELNSLSLIQLPNPFFDLYTSCKNIKHVSFISVDIGLINIPNDFNCNTVETIDTINFSDDTIPMLIEVLSKFPNVKRLQFSTWCSFQSESFTQFFTSLNAPKVTQLQFQAQYLEDDTTFDFIVNRFPKLKRFEIEEHESMDFSYKCSPVFCCEKTQMSMESLEKLIMNYLIKGHRTISLTLSEKSENEVLDYFANKKDIMSKVKQVYFYGPSNKKIDYVKTLTINSDEMRGDIRHVDRLVIDVDVNQPNIIAIVKKVNPIILDINKDENDNGNGDDLAQYSFVNDVSLASLRFIQFKGSLKYIRKQNGFIKLD